jgi:hypothetical protein
MNITTDYVLKHFSKIKKNYVIVNFFPEDKLQDAIDLQRKIGGKIIKRVLTEIEIIGDNKNGKV